MSGESGYLENLIDDNGNSFVADSYRMADVNRVDWDNALYGSNSSSLQSIWIYFYWKLVHSE